METVPQRTLSAASALSELKAALSVARRILASMDRSTTLDTVAKVGRFTAGLLARLASAEARSLLVDLGHFTIRAPPVLARRALDVLRALRKLSFGQALRDPRDLFADVLSAVLDGLGGTAVKVSQVLSHSPYLPPAIVRRCSASLSNARCPVVPVEEVKRIIVSSCGVASCEELFARIDAVPLASASIAQVHAAELLDGTRVVVKVVRPGVLERLRFDLDLAVLLARLVDLLLGEELVREGLSTSLTFAASEVRRSVLAECDLVAERESMERFRAWTDTSVALRRAGLHGAVTVPRAFARCSGPEVLTMEFVEGALLSDVLAAERDTGCVGEGCDRRALGRALNVQALAICAGDVFHADLHAGNVVCKPDGGMAFLDFGVCGRLPRFLRHSLMMQACSFITEDVELFVKGFETVPDAPTIDRARLTAELAPLFEEFAPLNPLATRGAGIDPRLYSLLLRGQLVLARNGVQLPQEFSLLLKTGVFLQEYAAVFTERPEDTRALVEQLVRSCVAFVATHSSELPRELGAREFLPPLARSALVRQGAKRMATECTRTVAPPLLSLLVLGVALTAAMRCYGGADLDSFANF